MHLASQLIARSTGTTRRLAFSVPSHCKLLLDPAKQLAKAFAEIPLTTPKVRYLSSSSARLLTKTDVLRDDLALNMCRVVDWHGALMSVVLNYCPTAS